MESGSIVLDKGEKETEHEENENEEQEGEEGENNLQDLAYLMIKMSEETNQRIELLSKEIRDSREENGKREEAREVKMDKVRDETGLLKKMWWE